MIRAQQVRKAQARDASVAAAARFLRPRWLVAKADTGEVIFSASLSRPLERDGYVVVAV